MRVGLGGHTEDSSIGVPEVQPDLPLPTQRPLSPALCPSLTLVPPY